MINQFKILVFVYIIFALHFFNEIKAQSDTPEKLLSELIQLKSITGTEREFGEYLVDHCRQKGLHTRIFENDSSFNFTASLYPLDLKKPNIIFMSHIDVVPSGDNSLWKYSPFEGKIAEGFVWGRGAIDCKGLLVMQLLAIENFIDSVKKNNYPYNITFLAVSGEETSDYSGANFVAKNFLNELNPIAMYGEGGSGMTHIIPSKPDLVVFGISVAEKKALWLKLETNTKTMGHGAAPPTLYANKKLIKSLIKLLDEKRLIKFGKIARKMFKEMGRLEGGVKGFVMRHVYWEVFWPFVKRNFDEGEIMHTLVYNTFVITGLYNNEIIANQIADKAYAILDCRLLPETNSEKFIKKIENLLGPKIEVSILNESPGAEEPSDFKSIYYTNLEEATKEVYQGSEVVPFLFPATTDNNYFRQYDIPVYGFLPVIFSDEEINSVHNINEKISITSLHNGIEVYQKFIVKMFNDKELIKRRKRKLNEN